MIAIGDKVQIRFPPELRASTQNVTYTILVMPIQVNNGPTWWEILGTEDGKTYVITSLVSFEIIPP